MSLLSLLLVSLFGVVLGSESKLSSCSCGCCATEAAEGEVISEVFTRGGDLEISCAVQVPEPEANRETTSFLSSASTSQRENQ